MSSGENEVSVNTQEAQKAERTKQLEEILVSGDLEPYIGSLKDLEVIGQTALQSRIQLTEICRKLREGEEVNKIEYEIALATWDDVKSQIKVQRKLGEI